MKTLNNKEFQQKLNFNSYWFDLYQEKESELFRLQNKLFLAYLLILLIIFFGSLSLIFFIVWGI